MKLDMNANSTSIVVRVSLLILPCTGRYNVVTTEVKAQRTLHNLKVTRIASKHATWAGNGHRCSYFNKDV